MSYDPFNFIESLYLKKRKAHSKQSEFDKELVKSITSLGAAYRIGERPEITSSNDRLAYTIQYAPIGIAAVRRLVSQLRSKPLPPQFSLLWDVPLRIVSVGAGPGTDLFGILLELAIPPKGLSFTRIDMHT